MVITSGEGGVQEQVGGGGHTRACTRAVAVADAVVWCAVLWHAALGMDEHARTLPPIPQTPNADALAGSRRRSPCSQRTSRSGHCPQLPKSLNPKPQCCPWLIAPPQAMISADQQERLRELAESVNGAMA